MDMKNVVDGFGVQEMSEKFQELRGKVHELSERPMVSISVSW